MKVRVEEITADAKELSFNEPEGDINHILEKAPLKEFHLQGPVGVTVSFYRAGTELFFRAGCAPVPRPCARDAPES